MDDAQTGPLRIRRLGDFEIVGELGRGGMGEEYRARDTRLDRDLAVKVLPDRVRASPKSTARVFERFYRVDKDRSRQNGGIGLGLAIAPWAVEANGGKIESETEQDKGSTFRIVLPNRGDSK